MILLKHLKKPRKNLKVHLNKHRMKGYVFLRKVNRNKKDETVNLSSNKEIVTNESVSPKNNKPRKITEENNKLIEQMLMSRKRQYS